MLMAALRQLIFSVMDGLLRIGVLLDGSLNFVLSRTFLVRCHLVEATGIHQFNREKMEGGYMYPINTGIRVFFFFAISGLKSPRRT